MTELERLEKQLQRIRNQADKIKEILSPWRGMTFSEARKHGFGSQEEKLQKELWLLGYRIIELEHELAKEEEKNGTVLASS